MEATQAHLLHLLDGKKQFTIPIYQRTYSWQRKQCEQLLDDILRIGQDEQARSHFIGSIVYFKPNTSPSTSVQEYLVIDGQQRLTTVSLILLALIHYLKTREENLLHDESWEEIQETYLVNKHRKDDTRYKLLLTRKDKPTYIKLIQGIDLKGTDSQRITDNYHFFLHQITPHNVQFLYHGIKKLLIVDFKSDTSYPLLLAVYHDYAQGVISEAEFGNMLDLVIHYVFRRVICGIPTNSLNKTFAILYRQVDRERYVESLQAAFLLMKGYRRFPTDAEFKAAFQSKDLYHLRSRNYVLETLENWQRKERISIDNYTIEHIMPQNPQLSKAWQEELGADGKGIHEKYLHTIGNLTLTGYNSELSDRPFGDKKRIEGGFDMSPLWLNRSVRKVEQWNEETIVKRAKLITERACEIWDRPMLGEEVLAGYVQEQKEDTAYNLSTYPHLQGEMMDLYLQLEQRIMKLDAEVRRECRKKYIAFKAVTNFVDVIPQKRRLRLLLNLPFHEVNDPRSICRDVSNKGNRGS